MKVKVKFVNDNAKELYFKASDGNSVFPFKNFDDDFCYDVVATSCTEVAPNVYKYGIGLAFQIQRGWETIQDGGKGWEKLLRGNPYYFESHDSPLKFSIDFRPRSSVWKTGMVLSNSQGTIDEGYTNEVSAVFYHIMPNMPKYEIGDKIGQIKIGATFPIEFVEVKQLDKTERGNGGFGSTGK